MTLKTNDNHLELCELSLAGADRLTLAIFALFCGLPAVLVKPTYVQFASRGGGNRDSRGCPCMYVSF